MTKELIVEIKCEYKIANREDEGLRKELGASGVPTRLLDQKEPIAKGKGPAKVVSSKRPHLEWADKLKVRVVPCRARCWSVFASRKS